MTDPTCRRAYAAAQAYNWARVASGLKGALQQRHSARGISNTDPAAVSEWQRWLLDHLDAPDMDVQLAINLAEMWVRVAALQPQGDDAPSHEWHEDAARAED
jgi:hypothetical protein